MGMQNTMIKKVLLCAPALTISGYGVHSRQIFNWLEDMGFDLKVHAHRNTVRGGFPEHKHIISQCPEANTINAVFFISNIFTPEFQES